MFFVATAAAEEAASVAEAGAASAAAAGAFFEAGEGLSGDLGCFFFPPPAAGDAVVSDFEVLLAVSTRRCLVDFFFEEGELVGEREAARAAAAAEGVIFLRVDFLHAVGSRVVRAGMTAGEIDDTIR